MFLTHFRSSSVKISMMDVAESETLKFDSSNNGFTVFDQITEIPMQSAPKIHEYQDCSRQESNSVSHSIRFKV